METVSVIVPVYNAQDYLRQCVDSILNQTYTNLEVWLINDGSSDLSASICEEYRKKDSRVHVHHKKLGGGGVGATRNTALSLITGDYVLFVDNDDWLEANHIELLYQSLKETDSDIAIANFTEYMEEAGNFQFHLRADEDFQEVYTPQEWFKNQYTGRWALSQCFTVPWSKLYKRHLLDDIVYPETEKVEDDYTTWKIYLMADRIVYRNVAIYYHRKRQTSVTKTVEFASVFPVRTIEERVAILSLIGMDISQELDAYRWRLERHRSSFLEAGKAYEYKLALQKLRILEKWYRR